MKLPETQRERMMWYGGAAVAVVLVVVAGVFWGILPALDARRELESSLIKQRDNLKKAKRELDYLPGMEANLKDIKTQLDAIRTQNILRPTLGSYLMSVTEQLEAIAKDCGVKVENVRELGQSELLQDKKKTSLKTFKIFAVQFNGEGSYGAIGRFLAQIEKQNPFLTVASLDITGQTDNPMAHRVAIRLEWPIEPATEVKKEVTP